MSRIKIQYRTSVVRNPATNAVVANRRRPKIVGLRVYTEDELFALDNNYIEGAKCELAKGIVKGVVETLLAEQRSGEAARDWTTVASFRSRSRSSRRRRLSFRRTCRTRRPTPSASPPGRLPARLARPCPNHSTSRRTGKI